MLKNPKKTITNLFLNKINKQEETVCKSILKCKEQENTTLKLKDSLLLDKNHCRNFNNVLKKFNV